MKGKKKIQYSIHKKYMITTFSILIVDHFRAGMTNSWPAGHLWPSGPIWVALEISIEKKTDLKREKKDQDMPRFAPFACHVFKFSGEDPRPLLRLRTLKYASLCSAFYEHLGLLFFCKSQILDRFIVFSI